MAENILFTDLGVGMNVGNMPLYCNTFEARPKKSGSGEWGVGTLTDMGKNTMLFKVWDAPIIEVFKLMVGKIVLVNFTVTEYEGKQELKITAIHGEVEDLDKSLFLPSTDVEGNRLDFNTFVNNNLSPAYIKALLTVMQAPLGEGTVFSKFKVEFAAVIHHDNLRGGLLNHTLKMLKIAKALVEGNEQLAEYKDMLYLSVILHDVGKVLEYDEGQKSEIGFVTHHVLGVELLTQLKTKLVEDIGEGNYYRLLSVIQGHHGEFGDRPTSVYAYIVHLIDMLESQTTGIFDKIERKDISLYGANSVVKSSGYTLVI